jgi:hypothetical protein
MYTSCTLLWRRFSYLIVIVAILSLSLSLILCVGLLSFHFFLYFTSLPLTWLSFSLSLSFSIVCVFYSCLFVRAYIEFSRRVFVAYTSLFHFRSVVYLLYTCTRTRACQRDKQLILACRDGQLLTALTVFPNLSAIDNKILTIK